MTEKDPTKGEADQAQQPGSQPSPDAGQRDVPRIPHYAFEPPAGIIEPDRDKWGIEHGHLGLPVKPEDGPDSTTQPHS